MLIVGDNLKQLCKQHEVCMDHLVEEFSIQIHLGRHFYQPKQSSFGETIKYERENSAMLEHLYEEKKEIQDTLKIGPSIQILASSESHFRIPKGYFGLVQTKGTLARLFVMATCNDGQIEPGFHGHITLELVNLSPWVIEIPFKENIAQLFIFKCSSAATESYNGRYAKSSKIGPTLPIFK